MNKDKTATVFDIQKCSFIDGPGIRTTVFFKGCNLACKWCHNPESQSPKRELMIQTKKCVGCGKCLEKCPNKFASCDLCGKCTTYCPVSAREIVGKEYTVDQVLSEILLDKQFYLSSGGGVTFSGGECMLRVDFLAELLKKCKENGVHTAIDTAGCVPYESFLKVLPYTDLILYDVKCFSEELHLQGTGVSNRLILKNLERLSRETDCEIMVRIPVIPGYNTAVEELSSMAKFLASLRIKAVELLPYHTMGNYKYQALNRTPFVYDVPTEENMAYYKKLFGIE